MPIIVLSIIIQLALVVHILKTGRNTTWVFIVLFFPLVGSLAYLIVELIPEFTGSRRARNAQRSISKAINPDKDLRAAIDQYTLANTAQNAMELASQYLQRSQYNEAKELYERALSGVHEDDPDILLGLAHAHFGLRQHNEALGCLDTLKEKHPDRTSHDGQLLYARASDEVGRTQDAIKEYESLISYYPGPEPTCRLATILKAQSDHDRANELFRGVLKAAKFAGKHYNAIHKEWVSIARQETHS